MQEIHGRQTERDHADYKAQCEQDFGPHSRAYCKIYRVSSVDRKKSSVLRDCASLFAFRIAGQGGGESLLASKLYRQLIHRVIHMISTDLYTRFCAARRYEYHSIMRLLVPARERAEAQARRGAWAAATAYAMESLQITPGDLASALTDVEVDNILGAEPPAPADSEGGQQIGHEAPSR